MVLKIYECDCQICSKMCHSPCCGTPECINQLIDAGYADRLMYDHCEHYDVDHIKPALKGFEGKMAPYDPYSEEGCTFWINGKCELHNLGLKPLQGKLTHHTLKSDDYAEIVEFIVDSWRNEEKSLCLVNKWKKLNNY